MKKIVSIALVFVMLILCITAFTSCGEKENLKIIDVKLTNEEYAFAVNKTDTALQSDFNAYLDEIKANGTFQTIVDKYFKGTGTKVGCDISTDDVTNTPTNFVVATNCPFEPFEYVGEDGKAYGIDMEIAAGYAAAKGLTLVVKNIDFDSILGQIENGSVDIGMAGMTVNAERLQQVNFTSTYYNASQKIVVPVSCTDFDACTTVEEVENILKGLTGKAIGFQNGTTGNWYVAGDEGWGYEGFANITAKGYVTALDAMMDMQNGNLYAVVVDEAPGAAMVASINK